MMIDEFPIGSYVRVLYSDCSAYGRLGIINGQARHGEIVIVLLINDYGNIDPTEEEYSFRRQSSLQLLPSGHLTGNHNIHIGQGLPP